MSPTFDHLLANADAALPIFIKRTEGITREIKGIRPSEMFFLFAALAGNPPRRIIESGRARAQSTLVLARCFPATEVISIESDLHSLDVEVAKSRLAGIANVDSRFGDARLLLPQIIADGDVVLIDGPKDFRAAKLVLRLLRTRRPSAIFLHDLPLGDRVRQFFDGRVRSAFFSDEPAFVRRFGFLDDGLEPPPRRDVVTQEVPRRVYGATMGCFPPGIEHINNILLRLTLLQWRERLSDSSCKRFIRPRE